MPVVPPCWPVYSQACYYQVGTSFDPVVDSHGDNTDQFSYLDHDEDICRYVNYWASRLWSFFYWFPPGSPQSQWPVLGSPIDDIYWIAKGDQWEYQTDLPEGEQTRRRTTLVSAPLALGAQASFILLYIMGTATSWWGDATFKVDEVTPEDEVTLTSGSSSLWTFGLCSESFDGTGITLTPDPGESSITAEFAFGSWTVAPYMFAHICDRFEFDWEDANIDSVTISLISEDGTAEVVFTTGKTEVFRPVDPVDDKYAGSWEQDFGVGLISDVGVDLLGSGMSATTMADPELVHAFSLLGGRGAHSIRFDIEVTDPGSTVKILYPVMRSPEVASTAYDENKSQVAVVWPDRPGIRFGNAQHFHDDAHSPEPVVLPPGIPTQGWKPSVLDWLTFKRLFLQAKAFDEDLATEIASLYDSEEATDAEGVNTASVAYLLPLKGDGSANERVWPRAALVNGASCPPVASFPRRARATDWQPTGDFAQESVSHAVEPRYFVGNFRTHQFDLGGVQWTTTWPSVDGWPVAAHVHAVDNTEADFPVQRGSDQIATMSPWQGCFSVRKHESTGIHSISSDVGLDKRHVIAYSDGVQVHIATEDHALNQVNVSDLGFNADEVFIRIDRRSSPQRFRLWTVTGTTIEVRTSTDGCATFGSPSTVGSGEKVTADIALSGTEYVYWLDGTDIKGRRYDRAGNALEAEFVAVAGVDDEAISVTVLPISEGVERVVLRYVAGGVRMVATSQDGVNF